jgi:hypothetical protein
MSIYKHKSFNPLRLVSMCLRTLARLIQRWPLVLLAACIISPISPHVLWEYQYQIHGIKRYKTACTYVGFRGYVHLPAYGDCSFIDIIDTRGRE